MPFDVSSRSDMPAWQVGVATGLAAGVRSFEPSLLGRAAQNRSTGIAVAAGFSAGVGGEKLVDGADRLLPGGTLPARAAVVAAGAAAPIVWSITGRTPGPAASVAAALGGVLAAGAAIGGVVDGGRTLAGSRGLDVDGLRGQVAVGGALVGAGALAMAVRGRQTAAARELGMVVEQPAALVAGAPEVVPAGRAWTRPPDEPGRLVAYEDLGVQGQRFRDTVTRDPDLAEQAKRVFVPVGASDSIAERARMAVAETEAIGGLDRDKVDDILIWSTTGSGFVPRTLLAAKERMADGRSTIVAMQYSTKRSVHSFRKVDDAAELQRETARQFERRLDELYPDGRKPRLLVGGESLGQAGSEKDIAAHGLEPFQKGLMIGRPNAWGPWRGAGLPAGATREITSLEQLRALSRDELDATKVLVFKHENDPVVHGDLALFARRPKGWKQPWTPFVTGMQTTLDLIRSTSYKVVPGDVRSRGPHDYREAHFELVRAMFHPDITDQRLLNIRAKVLADEAAYPGNAGV